MAINYTVKATGATVTVAGLDIDTTGVYLMEIDVANDAERIAFYDALANHEIEIYLDGNMVINSLGIANLYIAQVAMFGDMNDKLFEDVLNKRRIKGLESIGTDAIKEEISYIIRGEKGKKYYQEQRRTLRLSKESGDVSEADADAIYDYTEGAKLALLGEDVVTARKKIQSAIAQATSDGANATILTILGNFESDLLAMEAELY